MTSRPTTGRPEALDEYLEAAELEEPKAALFQSVDPAGRRLTGRALRGGWSWPMIKRRAAAAGLPPSTCCHTFRATGITAYLSNGGTLEHAQQIAGHASPKTTKLYDRTADTVTVDEIERIVRESLDGHQASAVPGHPWLSARRADLPGEGPDRGHRREAGEPVRVSFGRDRIEVRFRGAKQARREALRAGQRLSRTTTRFEAIVGDGGRGGWLRLHEKGG